MALSPPIKKLLDEIARALAQEDLRVILANLAADGAIPKPGELPSAPTDPTSTETKTPGTDGPRG